MPTPNDWKLGYVPSPNEWGTRTVIPAATAADLLPAPVVGQLEYQVDINQLTVKKAAGRKKVLTEDDLPVWVDYVPTLSFGAGLVLGNGSARGHYRRDGRFVQFQIDVYAGTTTVWGASTGNVGIGLPPFAPTEYFGCAGSFQSNSAAVLPQPCSGSYYDGISLQLRKPDLSSFGQSTWAVPPAGASWISCSGTYVIT